MFQVGTFNMAMLIKTVNDLQSKQCPLMIKGIPILVAIRMFANSMLLLKHGDKPVTLMDAVIL